MAELSEVHRRAIVVAAHTDIIGGDVDYWRMGGRTRVLEERHVPTLRAGGVTVICDHIGGDTRYAFLPATNLTTSPLQRVMRMLDHAYEEARESESIVLALTADDIQRAKREDKLALVICLEGASPLETELSYLRNFHRLGLRCLGLTHNWRNALADGCMERSGGGLTHFGIAVVKECNALGIVVDVSHMSDRGTEDTLVTSAEPIIASHSNARALREHPRNLPDELIQGIAGGGGVIGIHALNTLVSDAAQPTLDDLMRHLVHIVEIGGIDCVGIGPDLLENWQEQKLHEVNEGAHSFTAAPFRALKYRYPTGLQSVADLPNLTARLASLGFGDDDIAKVLGGNFLRVFEQVWG